MTEPQFDALAKLLRLRQGKSKDAARMVLVGGLAPSEAARETGLSLQAVSNVVTRCKRGIDLAKTVCGICRTVG
jgi:DNA-directed RNA polymerase specialized sigma24 family protein